MTAGFKQRRVLFLISAALVAATIAAYEPIRHNDFVNYDDGRYITENPDINEGITRNSVIRAFTQSHFYMWHPLTTLSHILDCQLFGLNPRGHHLVSVLLHIINAILLLWLLTNMTGSTWPSAFVAAVFALHPLQVQSVAWASERKTVMSGLFWFLTMAVYVWYTRRPVIGRYISLLGAYALCLMTKPVVVTLPFVLLLLDYWPLDRVKFARQIENTTLSEATPNGPSLQKAPLRRLVTEKIPLFVLSAVLCVVTFVAQMRGGAVSTLKFMPLHIRVINALGSYLHYVVKMLYPKGLAVLYPFSDKLKWDAAALAVMGVIVVLVLWGRGRRWLVVGLLWYLGTLVPVIGLVQVGEQTMADRYTYLPLIGVFLIIAWAAVEIFSKMRYSRTLLASGAAAALIAMVLMTRTQVRVWQDSSTLYKQALAITKDNVTAHYNYGVYLCDLEQYDEAIRHFKEVVRIYPEDLPVRENICVVLLAENKPDEAISCYTKALEEKKDWPEMHKMYNGLGCAYSKKGDLALAEINYRKALSLKPDYEPARKNLALLLAKQGKLSQPPLMGEFELPKINFQHP